MRYFSNLIRECDGGKQAKVLAAVTGILAVGLMSPAIHADPVPGGSLDPLSIPKYVTPLVIPPVMNSSNQKGDNYEIAVRQFKQQILPGGIWNTLNGRNDPYPATTVWSYGPEADPMPDSSALGGGPGIAPAPNSQFNYPSYTVENTVNTTTNVTWINELVVDPITCNASKPKDRATNPACNYLSHIVPVDRSLHWANPEGLPCKNPAKVKDCRPANTPALAQAYTGPVPIVTHVHGAHVGAESDGYPEAWWLPDANNIPAGYATTGSLVNQYGVTTNRQPGRADYSYPNTQPSTTLWFHDHSLGITRNNVYAGPAGFWLIREAGGMETGLIKGRLPKPAPKPGDLFNAVNLPGTPEMPQREKWREIPIVIQDRSFNADGSLFYPANRAFFEGLGDGTATGPMSNIDNGMNIATFGNGSSDISHIWNPEAFFNVMVVNGVAWPSHEVAQAMYRFRLLNGCNSRFLNMAMFVVNDDGSYGAEIPFYQIGAEQSLLPNVVKIETGYRTVLPGDGTIPASVPADSPQTALLMGPAERADVLVDFSGIPDGTHIRVVNTAPDAPYGGFPDVPADPGTTGQVMEFVVNSAFNGVANTDPGRAAPATAPQDLVLSLPDPTDPANGPVFPNARDLALIEKASDEICVNVAPSGEISQDLNATPNGEPDTCVLNSDMTTVAESVPFAPREAVLGTNGSEGGSETLWSSPIATNPALGATETWELWNTTEDAHPIHLHLVKFKVIERELLDEETQAPSGVINAPELTESGWKDTVIAYPGQVTRINSTFDVAGLYVWHCHILEHEDNEMMVPYCVGDKATSPGCNAVP